MRRTASGVHVGEPRLRAVGEVADQPPEAQIPHLLLVLGQEPLGDELEEHGVRALEGREDVGVGAQPTEPVRGEIALAPARLAAHLEGRGAVRRRVGLEPRRLHLEPPPLLVPGCRVSRTRPVGEGERRAVLAGVGELAIGAALGQRAHREMQPVRGAEGNQQAALMREVAEKRELLAAGRSELPAERGPAHRHGELDLGRAHRGRRDADPARDQGAEHREEAAIRARDRTRVAPLFVHGREAIEQVRARHPDAGEAQEPVVDAFQPHLAAAVRDLDAGQGTTVRVADRDQERMHAVVLAADQQPHEHGRHVSVEGRVADPVLAGRIGGGVDHERAGGRIVTREGLQIPNVRAVPHLRHRVAAGQGERAHIGQVAAMMALRPQVQDTPAEQPELHAVLDQHAAVTERERLEHGERGAGIALAAHLARVAERAETLLGQPLHRGQHALAVLRARQLHREDEGVLLQQLEHAPSHLGVRAREQLPDRVDPRPARRRGVRGRARGRARLRVRLGQDAADHLLRADPQLALEIVQHALGLGLVPYVFAPLGSCER